jgi:glycerophosphoryl diester phosphodiesterase
VIGVLDHGATAATVPRGGGARALIVAHRGAWDQAPQNSLEAVRRAVTLGCDGIEIDVRRTADGQMVVVHDARLGWRRLRGLEHREVQTRMEPGQAPLLRDVLDEAAGRLLVDVELKEDGYVGAVMDLVAERLAPDSYVVTSFAPAVLAQVRRHRPQTRTGLLIGPRGARQVERWVRAAAADFLAPHVSMARAGILEWAAQRELAAWVWTVNDARTLRTLGADRRVAALITDEPADAVALSHSVDLADSRE